MDEEHTGLEHAESEIFSFSAQLFLQTKPDLVPRASTDLGTYRNIVSGPKPVL